MTYTDEERARAIAWKAHTAALPATAKVPAPYAGKDGTTSRSAYDFCLPTSLAGHNLLPEVREQALTLFTELGIPWHASIAGGPSNHLLSSQVQCVNALGQMVTDPGRIRLAFGDIVDITEVLEIESGRFLTFEYIGPTDFFGEAPTGPRIRGAHCTSVDAAFLVRAADGETELVLVEWKYTESYRRRADDPARDAVRLKRYGEALADPAGPVRDDLLEFALMVDEPFYQLVRQQLLAHELEKSGVADRVRVVHLLSPRNAAYQRSLARPEHRAVGGTVSEVWQQLLRRPDRYASLDPEVFLDPEVTSTDYIERYAHDLVRDEADLCAAFDVTDFDDVAEHFDADLLHHPDGVELYLNAQGWVFDYPFRLADLQAQDAAWT